MTRQIIADQLTANYCQFVNYISSLTKEEYTVSLKGKWTAGQQLQHVVLCVQPLVVVFGLDKVILAQKFGTANKPGRTYQELLDDYKTKLN